MSLPLSDFSILYIHCFVYTVYDDFSGQQSDARVPGQDPARLHTNITATETDTGELLLLYGISHLLLLNVMSLAMTYANTVYRCFSLYIGTLVLFY